MKRYLGFLTAIGLYVVSATLVGCSSAEKEMLDGVRAQLKDPNSAEFSQLKHHELSDGSGRLLCGMVNSKNSYGGYVGARPFTVAMSTDATQEIIVEIGNETSCESFIRVGEDAARNNRKR